MRTRYLAFAILSVGPAAAQSRNPGDFVRDLAVERQPVEGVAPPVAQSSISVGAAIGTPVTIGAVVVDGLANVPRAEFAPAIGSFLGRQTDAATLRELAAAVAAVARARGYVFASASVPSQAVEAGRVAVTLVGGRIDEVRIDGAAPDRLKRLFERLVGDAVERRALEEVLLLARDMPGIDVTGSRLVHEGDRAVLIVETRARRGDGYASVDNHGSDEVGPVRLRLRYDFNGIGGAGDSMTVQAVVTPIQPRELTYVTLRYATLVDMRGTEVGVTASIGRAQPEQDAWNGRSSNRSIGVFASTPLQRRRAASLWVNGEFAVQRIDGHGDSEQRDSLATLSLWLYGTVRTGRGRMNGAAGVVRGLGIAGTTTKGDPLSSRFDGSGRFTKGYAWANWTMPLGGALSVQLGVNGQLADRPLLASQEIGLGGIGFGRAYGFYDRFGDAGVMGVAELRWMADRADDDRDWVQFHGFVDGGHVWNLRGGFGGGSLSSGGLGLRLGFGRTEVGAELAVPIAADASSPIRRTPRVNVSIGRRFN